jgi:hypothetical protein
MLTSDAAEAVKVLDSGGGSCNNASTQWVESPKSPKKSQKFYKSPIKVLKVLKCRDSPKIPFWWW